MGAWVDSGSGLELRLMKSAEQNWHEKTNRLIEDRQIPANANKARTMVLERGSESHDGSSLYVLAARRNDAARPKRRTAQRPLELDFELQLHSPWEDEISSASRT